MDVHCKYGKLVAVDSLVANPRNPNTHPTEQIERLATVLKTQGWRVPVVVSNLSGFIVRGHGRVEAAKIAGFKKVPVDYQDYENEAAEWSDLIADNRLAELSSLDNEKLKDVLNELDQSNADLELTGFNENEIETLMTQIYQGDERGKTPEEWAELYDESQVRQIVLIYPEEEFDEIMGIVGRIRDENGLSNNTEAVTLALKKFGNT